MTSPGGVTAPGEPRTARRSWFILAILCVSLLVVSIDTTIINIVLPTLVNDLHATESQLQWVVDAYSCVFAGLLLVAGTVGDRFGRKWVFLAGLVIFASGSTWSAFSGSIDTLIVARAVMGVGSACIMPATLSIITDVFREPGRQARAIGIWSGTTGLGIALGPITGGWLLDHFWWGSVFLINVPVAALGVIGALAVVPNSFDATHRRIDAVGAGLSALALGLLLYSIIDIPTDGWTSPRVIVTGVAALALIAGFVAWERRTSHPLLVLDAFSNRRYSVAMGAVALSIFALTGALFTLTQYLQFSLGFEPFQTGLRILPIALVLGVAAVGSTRLDRWLGTKVVVATGLVIVAGGLWQLTATSTSSRFVDVLPGMLLLGLGAGFIIAPATASVMGSLPRDRAGVGSATNSTALQIGGALGVAVIGSVLTSHYRGAMTSTIAGHAMPASARSAILGSLGGALDVAKLAGAPMGTLLAAAARAAFVHGMTDALAVGAVVVLVSAALVVAALPPRRRADPPAEGAPSDPGAGVERVGPNPS